MKVAVLFSGIPRNNYIENIKDHQTVFEGADFYYQTWHSYQDKLLNYKPLIVTTEPRPKFNVYDNLDDPYIKSMPFRRIHKTNDSYLLHERFMSRQPRRVIQFIAYNDCYKLLTSQYDVVIKARYDVKISVKLKNVFRYLTRKCFETQRVVGFNYEYRRKDMNKIVFGMETPPWDSKIYRIHGERMRWLYSEGYHAIPDFLIMHPASFYDTMVTDKLYKDKKLFSSEPGWWQVLARHKARALFYYGGVVVERFIEGYNLNAKN